MELNIDDDLATDNEDKILKSISTPLPESLYVELKALNQKKLHKQTREFFRRIIESVHQRRDQEPA